MNRHLRLLDFALASLLRSRARTFVVVAVYALLFGTAASLLLFVGALREEARHLLEDAPEIVVQRLVGGRHELIPVARAAAVAKLRGVAAVTPRVWGYYYDPAARATYTFWGADSVPPDSLDFLDGDLAEAEDPRVCYVGQGVAEVRFLGVGDRLPIKAADGSLAAPRVAGVFTAESALLTNDLVVMPTAQLRRIFGMAAGEATDLAVAVTNPREAPTLARKIQEAWPDVRVITRRQIQQTWEAVFDWRGGLWVAILGGSIAAFGILVWNQANGLSAEEFRTLGLLKAVGWSPREVLELELWKGLIISVTSVVTGLLLAQLHLAWLGGGVFTRVLQGWSVLFPPLAPSPRLDLGILLPCFLLAVVPFVAASLVPSWRAAVADPDTVMRS